MKVYEDWHVKTKMFHSCLFEEKLNQLHFFLQEQFYQNKRQKKIKTRLRTKQGLLSNRT